MLFPVFELLDQSLSFTLVGPPVGDVRPKVAIEADHAVLIGDNHLVTQRPQVPQRHHFLEQRIMGMLGSGNGIMGKYGSYHARKHCGNTIYLHFLYNFCNYFYNTQHTHTNKVMDY